MIELIISTIVLVASAPILSLILLKLFRYIFKLKAIRDCSGRIVNVKA